MYTEPLDAWPIFIANIIVIIWEKANASSLTFSWRKLLSYRNQSIDLWSKLMDWFLYDNGLRHERVKITLIFSPIISSPSIPFYPKETNVNIWSYGVDTLVINLFLRNEDLDMKPLDFEKKQKKQKKPEALKNLLWKI